MPPSLPNVSPLCDGSEPAAIGAHLGDWTLVAYLGEGRLGRAWLARDSEGREAIIQLPHDEVPAGGALSPGLALPDAAAERAAAALAERPGAAEGGAGGPLAEQPGEPIRSDTPQGSAPSAAPVSSSEGAGGWERAREIGERALAEARALKEPALEVAALEDIGDLALAMGNLAQARARYAEAWEIAACAGLAGEEAALARRRAELALFEQAPDAELAAEQALAAATLAGDAVEVGWSRVLLAVARARSGAVLPDLDRCINEVTETMLRAGRLAELARVRVWAAEACVVSGQLEEADFLVDRALAWARGEGHFGIERRALQVREGIDGLRPPVKCEASLPRVLELAGELARETRSAVLLEKIAAAALELLRADRAFVILGQELPRVAASRGGEPGEEPSWGIIEQVLDRCREVISADLGELPEWYGELIAAMSLRSVMCVPMLDGREPIGAIYVDSETSSQADLRRRGHLLRALASLASLALSRTRWVERAIQSAALEVELAERRRSERELRAYAEELSRLNQQLDSANTRLERALAEARSAVETRGRFLAVMSHELRTPLSGVLGTVELLEQSPLSAEQREQLGLIQISSQHLLELIDQVLTFSKLDAGQLHMECEPFDLVEVVEQMLQLVGSSHEARGLRLVSAVDPSLWGRVRGRPGWLRQILLNLLGNAVRHTDEGFVRLAVRDCGGDRVRFEVTDSGEGIPSEKISSLFMPFVQGDVGSTRRRGGVGLGLAIVRELVQLQGGELSCTSEIGRGSTFCFEIALPVLERTLPERWLEGRRCAVLTDEVQAAPLRTALECWGATLVGAEQAALVLVDGEAAAAAAPGVIAIGLGRAPGRPWVPLPISLARLRQCIGEALEGAPSSAVQPAPAGRPAPVAAIPPGEGPRVLVVDDHPVNRMVLSRMLELLGCQVDLASSGEEALERLGQPPPELVLMDCEMPVLDGVETAELLLRAGWRSVPIVALTAHIFEAEQVRCTAAGMREVLTKPVSREELAALICRYVAPLRESA